MYHYIIFFSKTILLFNRAEPPQADEWSQREDEARALDGHQGKEDQGADRQEPRVRGREADEEAQQRGGRPQGRPPEGARGPRSKVSDNIV